MIAKLFYHDNTDNRYIEVNLPDDFTVEHYIWIEKSKSMFEVWCEKIGFEVWQMKGMLDFVYNAKRDDGGYKNPLQCIKLARMFDKSLGLKEAKDLIDSIYK